MLGADRPVLGRISECRPAEITESSIVDDVFTATLHDTLSDRELYLRFFTTHPVFLATLAETLTDSDGGNYALGAFESGTLIGVAHYAMCGKPATADVAVVVAHEDHLRGVGTALLRRLAQIAGDNGIQHLVADVLTTNHLMFKVLHDAGLHPKDKRYDGGVVHLDIDLAAALAKD